MVRELARDGTGRRSRGRRGEGRLQQHLPLKVMFFEHLYFIEIVFSIDKSLYEI
jgi:hypothetical protein